MILTLVEDQDDAQFALIKSNPYDLDVTLNKVYEVRSDRYEEQFIYDDQNIREYGFNNCCGAELYKILIK